ncbi:MAG: type 1 glutamine amidotransferase domain-containing protein [Pirellulaceae bacterium]
MELQRKKVAILVEQLYEDLELWYPYYRLKEAGAEVVIVGPKARETYPSKHGYPAKSDQAADDVSAGDFDAVVIPGGYSPDHMRRSKAMVRLVRDMDAQGKTIAAICHGGWMLCSADVLKNRRVTSYSSIKDDVTHAGAQWVDEEVVEDGNLITSRQPADLPAFMRAVVQALSGVRSTV